MKGSILKRMTMAMSYQVKKPKPKPNDPDKFVDDLGDA